MITICVLALTFAMPAFCAGNLPAAGNIGDFGAWTTDVNRDSYITQLSTDLAAFQTSAQKQLVAGYVPIEAKIGLAFMNAMAMIGKILESSLFHFVTIFICIAFMFWMGFEAYQLIQGKAPMRETIEGIVKKGFTISIWLWVLHAGPAQVFMWIMGPIIMISSYLSDLILNAVSNTVGVSLPDTCDAIKAYTASHISKSSILDAESAANIMCIPTRMSGFFTTGVAAGWKWMLAGIGHSAFSFLMGAVFVVLFTVNIWSFALIALGVIADLFLTIFMLPFTAIAETVGETKYKGIAGTIYNGMIKVFSTQNLSAQISRFVNAAIYFVSMSLVVALCMALMSGVITADLAAEVPSLDNDGYAITLLTGFLVGYLALSMKSIIKDYLAGSINDELGQKFGNDIIKTTKNTYNQGKKYWKIYQDSKKSSSS